MPQLDFESCLSSSNGQSREISIQCIRRIQFCAGHRVWQHETKCGHLHGHNYVAFFYAAATALDSLGRVIDFSEIKNRLGSWIEVNWDHGFILNKRDSEGINAVTTIPGQKIYLLEGNPTAENLAHHLLIAIAPRQMAGAGVTVVKVILWETENSYAEASL